MILLFLPFYFSTFTFLSILYRRRPHKSLYPLKLHLKVVWAVFGLHYIPPTLFQNQAYKVYRIKKSFHST